MPTASIRLEPANIRPGQWCDYCHLPSRVTYDVVTVSEHGVSTLGHGTACTNCDPEGTDDA